MKIKYRGISTSRKAVGVVLVVGVVAAVVVMAAVLGAQSSTAKAAPVVLREEGAVVNQVAAPDEALRAASNRLGFPVKVPTFFPTSSNRLVLVDSSLGPAGVPSPLKLANLIYQSERVSTFGGVQYRDSVEIFETDVRLAQPGGQQIDLGMADGPDVWEERAEEKIPGAPAKVTYTILHAKSTYVVTFTGEQPARADLARMIASFK